MQCSAQGPMGFACEAKQEAWAHAYAAPKDACAKGQEGRKEQMHARSAKALMAWSNLCSFLLRSTWFFQSVIPPMLRTGAEHGRGAACARGQPLWLPCASPYGLEHPPPYVAMEVKWALFFINNATFLKVFLFWGPLRFTPLRGVTRRYS